MTPYFACNDVTVYQADSRTAWQHLPERSVHAIVTSPPYYGLRDYGVDGQIGLEDSPTAFVEELADLLTGYGERVLREDGSLWLNLGDTYSAYNNNRGESASISGGGRHVGLVDRPGLHGDHPAKCLLMIPERVALALIDRGWILRNKVAWCKPNGLPTSVRDRLATKWEYVFHLTRRPRYYYDLDAIREEYAPTSVDRYRSGFNAAPVDIYGSGSVRRDPIPADKLNPAGANPGDWWVIPTQPYPNAHFAVYPPALIRRPILATVPEQACRVCGTGRERVVQTGDLVPSWPGATNVKSAADSGHVQQAAAARDFTGGSHAMPRREREHVGWTDCGCDAGWQSGTVLDPFFGSGTTGVVARELNRRAVGVELNPDYCRLAADRFRQDVLFGEVTA